MEYQEAHAIKFRLQLDVDDIKETVYMSEESFENLPVEDPDGWATHDVDSIIPEYFTKEKIEQYKKDICKKIMESENPFQIYNIDLDGYPVEKEKIWK